MVGFGGYLKELRKERNLTVRKLAEESGVSQSYITNIENEKRDVPSPDVLEKISKTLSKYEWLSYADVLEKAGYKVLAKGVRLKEMEIDFAPNEVERSYPQNEIINMVEQELMIKHLSDIKTFLSKNYEPDNYNYEPNETGISFSPNYNGHKLTDDDRKRAIAVLDAMFPEYRERKNQ